jgi:hypothetical protein
MEYTTGLLLALLIAYMAQLAIVAGIFLNEDKDDYYVTFRTKRGFLLNLIPFAFLVSAIIAVVNKFQNELD